MHQARGQLTPKQDDGKEPITLNFNKTAFAMKNEECIRDAIRRSLPASILITNSKAKDIITGIVTIL